MQTGECQILEGNHENGSETGPYGSVRADIHTECIPQALGSLWDASRASKCHWKIKNQGVPYFSNIFIVFSYIFLLSLTSDMPAVPGLMIFRCDLVAMPTLYELRYFNINEDNEEE